MAHLGADVAAYVDGQLSESAIRAATRHLQDCDECAKAVRQQRLLKSRMSTVAAPEPPEELLASLAGLASVPPRSDSWWARLRRSAPVRVGVGVLGASLAVVVTAYLVGGPERALGDEIRPPFDRYAAEFFGAGAIRAASTISASTMDELDEAGWPCRSVLAGDLERTWAAYADRGDIVALSYSDGRSKLNLFEQRGALDRSSLQSFRAETMGGARVWVRYGAPLVVTWDDSGVVYTIVTDVERERVARAVAELPTPPAQRGTLGRIGDGLVRMTTWATAA